MKMHFEFFVFVFWTACSAYGRSGKNARTWRVPEKPGRKAKDKSDVLFFTRQQKVFYITKNCSSVSPCDVTLFTVPCSVNPAPVQMDSNQGGIQTGLPVDTPAPWEEARILQALKKKLSSAWRRSCWRSDKSVNSPKKSVKPGSTGVRSP